MQPYERPDHISHSDAQLIRFRDERKTLVFTLVNGTQIEGAVRWFDHQTYHLVQADRTEMTVLKHAVLYYQTV